MNQQRTMASSALFGSRAQTGVSRGLGEFCGRRPVLVTAAKEALLALPVDGLDNARIKEFTALCAPATPQLIVTERRARALGLDASMPMPIPLSTATPPPPPNPSPLLPLVPHPPS